MTVSQVEWLIKHPTRKRKRQKCFSGSIGRIKSLTEIIYRIPAKEEVIIYIHPNFQSIDSQFRDPEIYPYSTNFTFNLSDTLRKQIIKIMDFLIILLIQVDISDNDFK